MEDFETVAIFSYTHEIVVLKHRLEQEGIPYFFENETMTSIVPWYSNALGGIKLKVHPSDFTMVRTILEDFDDKSNLKIV